MPETWECPLPILKMSMVGSLGGDAGDLEYPPPILKMSMAGSLGGDAGDLGAWTTYVEDVDGRLPRRQCWRSESAHHLSWRDWWRPLGRHYRRLGAPTTYFEDVDGGTPGRQCQRPKSSHHLSWRLWHPTLKQGWLVLIRILLRCQHWSINA
jgi:hypothetical protein